MKRLFTAATLISLLLFLCFFTACVSGKNSKKPQLTEDMITQSPINASGNFLYSGKEVRFEEKQFRFTVNGQNVYPSLFDFTYANNVNAGTADLTITAKEENEYCQGSVTVHFLILQNDIEVKTQEALTAALDNPNYNPITVDGKVEIAAGTVCRIPKDKKVFLRGNDSLTVYGTLEIEGALVVDGSKTTLGTTTNGVLTNRGTVVNSGSLSVTERGIIYSYSDFSTVTFENKGTIYTVDNPIENVTTAEGGQTYVRHRLTEEALSVSYRETEYVEGTYSYTPTVSVNRRETDRDKHYTVTFFDCERAGVARFRVEMDEFDKMYYGSCEGEYLIKKGSVSVTDFAVLAQKAATENFATYVALGDLTVPADASFTLRAGEILDMRSRKLTVNGTFRNDGEIVSSTDTANAHLSVFVRSGGCFTHGGKWSAPEATVSASGRLVIASADGFSVKSLSVENVCENGSAIEAESLTVYKYGTLRNGAAGTVTADRFTVIGVCQNDGTVAVREKCVLNNGASLVNGAGAHLSLAVLSEWGTATVENAGKIVNTGVLYCADGLAFSGGQNGFDNAGGTVWAYAALSGVHENFTLKTRLSAENTALSAYSFVYDEHVKTVSVTFGGEMLNAEDFTVVYSPSYPVAVGTVAVTVTVTRPDCIYGGSYETSFEITKGTYTANTASQLQARIGNQNYETIKLGADVTLPERSYGTEIPSCSLAEGITLDTNGHTLTLQKINFNNYGRIYNSARPVGNLPAENCGLMLDRSAALNNYGTVENNNIICLRYTSSSLENMGDAGALINNGVIYCGQNLAVTPESVGTLVVRQMLTSAVLDLSFPAGYRHDYTGLAHTPDVVYTGTETVNLSDFEITYENNVNASQNAVVHVLPDAFNEVYYNTANLFFEVEKAVYTVSNENALLHAFDDTANYYGAILTANVTLNQSVVIPSGMTLNYSLYALSFGQNGKLCIADNLKTATVLLAEANSAVTLTQNLGAVQKITLVGDIADALTTIYIPATLKNVRNNATSPVPVSIEKITVETDGYDTGTLLFAENKIEYLDFYISNSSADESVIGDKTSRVPGLIQLKLTSSTQRLNLHLYNLTVAGAFLGGDTGGGGVELWASFCKFERSTSLSQVRDVNLVSSSWKVENGEAFLVYQINADTHFSYCSFDAATDFAALAETHEFSHCTFNYTVNRFVKGTKAKIYVEGVLYTP